MPYYTTHVIYSMLCCNVANACRQRQHHPQTTAMSMTGPANISDLMPCIMHVSPRTALGPAIYILVVRKGTYLTQAVDVTAQA